MKNRVKTFDEFVNENYSINENANIHKMAGELEAGYLDDTDFDPMTMPNAKEVERHHKSGKYEYILNKRFHGETMDWDEIKKRLSKARIEFIELKDSDDGDDQILF